MGDRPNDWASFDTLTSVIGPVGQSLQSKEGAIKRPVGYKRGQARLARLSPAFNFREATSPRMMSQYQNANGHTL